MKRGRGRPKGYKLSQASKDKIANSKRGQAHSKETKDKIANSLVDYFSHFAMIGGFTMIEGKRVLADPKFNMLDGKWDARDIANNGHRLIGIATMDIYSYYETGHLDDHHSVPDAVADRRRRNRPEIVHLRHKEQFVITKRLWCYDETPAKMAKLHQYIARLVNIQRTAAGAKRITIKDSIFPIYSFVTRAPSNHRCLWRIAIRAKGKDKKLIKFPILAKIDNLDAGLYEYKDALIIAGDMAFDECTMKKREYSTLACEFSGMTG